MEYQRDSPSFFVYPRAFSGALFTMSANESPNLSETLSTAYTIRIITRRHTMDTRIALIGVLLETKPSSKRLRRICNRKNGTAIQRKRNPYYQYRRRRPEQYHQRPFRQTRNASGRQHESDLRQNNVTYL